jgi:riboflavin kinase / FMN adenylyltransferase
VNALIEQTYTRIQDVPPAPTIVTIGAFDGVHRGHQHILGLAKARAAALQARLLVLTFEPLPIQVFRPEVFPGRILTPERRRQLLHRYGADAVVELQFDRQMSLVTAGEFLDMLFAIGPILEMWVGHDFALGYKREGTPGRLQELSQEHGTVVHVVDRIGLDGAQVSSTDVRRLIMDGRAHDASRMMGHRFQVSGEVQHGAQLGREIGFPTANVEPPGHLVPLKDGIYASYATIEGEGEFRPAMTYIGTRPAVNTGQRMIETHLFDFDGDLYGRELTTEFVQHLRPDQNFPGVDELVEQLKRDESAAREVLSRATPG